MNMQAMLKEAQKLQKNMLKTQEEINNTEYKGISQVVTVTINGKKEVINVKIDVKPDELNDDFIETLEDMIMIAFNDATKKVDNDTEDKLGAYAKGMPGIL